MSVSYGIATAIAAAAQGRSTAAWLAKRQLELQAWTFQALDGDSPVYQISVTDMALGVSPDVNEWGERLALLATASGEDA